MWMMCVVEWMWMMLWCVLVWRRRVRRAAARRRGERVDLKVYRDVLLLILGECYYMCVFEVVMFGVCVLVMLFRVLVLLFGVESRRARRFRTSAGVLGTTADFVAGLVFLVVFLFDFDVCFVGDVGLVILLLLVVFFLNLLLFWVLC